MNRDAHHGVVGDFLRLVEPHTEADEAALLVSFLIACGSYAGRSAHYVADGAKHFPNEFAVIVGATSKGRKGTSWNQVKQVLDLVDPAFAKYRCTAGLSSGEGLIWALRDDSGSAPAPTLVDDPDEVDSRDKRLLIVEGEFVRTLKAMGRESNTLSAVLRQAWDDGSLSTLTKNQPASCTDAHVSMLAHITLDDLRKSLASNDTANGFSNRFLWVWSTRSKLLPFGGDLLPVAFEGIANRVRQAVDHATGVRAVLFDDEAKQVWKTVYPELSEGGTGIVGAITSRNEAHAVRLATLYAILDKSRQIRLPHLKASLAVVDYSTRSVHHIFGGSMGHTTAEAILERLKHAGSAGQTRTELASAFGRNKAAAEISQALAMLERQALVYMKQEETGGRAAQRWFLRADTQTRATEHGGSAKEQASFV